MPMLMTAKQMSAVSSIGENTLRKWMDEGELECNPTQQQRPGESKRSFGLTKKVQWYEVKGVSEEKLSKMWAKSGIIGKKRQHKPKPCLCSKNFYLSGWIAKAVRMEYAERTSRERILRKHRTKKGSQIAKTVL